MIDEKKEPVTDIIAEMRDATMNGEYDDQTVEDWADRIEAAWKREKAECEAAATSKMLEGSIIIDNRGRGNAAAMRAALEQMLAVAAEMREEYIIDPRFLMDGWANTIESVARAALAAPPRNCDVGTADEQEARYHATGNLYHSLTLQEVLSWAQMPCEKGESNGKEV